MASTDKVAFKRPHSLSECSICLMAYTDPRMLSCFHSACLKCFEDIQSKNKKKPGDVLPCPLCRKEFTIPPNGMKGLQKNFFIESLMEVTKCINSKDCSTCSVGDETGDVTEATMMCLDCCENYCSRCSKKHKSQKLGKQHKIIEINGELHEEDIRKMFPVRYCKIHSKQELNYYCFDCKTVDCVSCFVENHQTHKCKDVTTVDKDFRQKLEESSEKMSEYIDQMLSKKMDMETQRNEYLEKTLETEKAIRVKSQELKSFIDQHAQAVLDELFLLKQKHQKKMESKIEEIEEIERKLTVVESFVAYCTELKSNGSASEVCSCADNLITRTKDISVETEKYLSFQSKSVEVKFLETDQNVFLQNVSNVIGNLSESTKEFESFAIVFGGRGFNPNSNDIIKINLNRSEDIGNSKQTPTKIQMEAAAAAYCKSIFVTGIGDNCDEIWRFDATSSNWKKCSSLFKGRRKHSAAFVEHVLYICGGLRAGAYEILDDVEAYDKIDDKCISVGRLCYPVHNSGNCVPFKASLYIFGGYDTNYKVISSVQVYDTKTNTCFLLSKPMPRASSGLQAVLNENSVILLGNHGFFIYNFDSKIWGVRDQFKIDSFLYFGLTVHNGKIFVIGGVDEKIDTDGRMQFIYRDDVRYIPVMNFLNDEPIEWRHYAKLPKPFCLRAIGKIDLCA